LITTSNYTHATANHNQRKIVRDKAVNVYVVFVDSAEQGKTIWSEQDNKNIGWYVGYLETKDNVFNFANCIQNVDFSNKDFAMSRKEIVYSILNDLRLRPK